MDKIMLMQEQFGGKLFTSQREKIFPNGSYEETSHKKAK